ncbi:receptor-like serine/threonine-protein kinase NCRK [Prosopis cineraria]|uniref:receptor-like serine/threonine-protein kinase NCRK n=1 Tax=Prosopis cineraria TaxID=364024 RepID=UPI0024101ED5|nr:receptor-like serine/threonine-protein kinase NCRK [Prosopis cineraria]XP_054793177.1 receptor-like serine/threonine-protein kinase NCRK [Prosopis cineraria]XP_054793178.1 receptor-like serine/threonine-protein kinase NCRK [Prosopis cineraria]XP_054793179.1 receptor-like serine/threonine-protein kinase NCRK [Prosopis cineraria]XP_054793180.1 receptor-like serine/threonine-protein kinase NCRK [Prosopis cineraria]XP_054793181.1 receptor-like serine/threonine-protein kinase NCRK [Prosopis cine
MKPQLEVVFSFVICLILLRSSLCDQQSDTSGHSKWVCRCSFQGNQDSIANCSTSCDCRSDAKESGSKWTCICDPNGFPKVAVDGHSPHCFTACKCTWGSLPMSQDSKKHISSKIIIVILLVCVACTTVAFLASFTCYVFWKDRCPIQSPMISSDKETSCNSTTNLISNGTSSVLETKIAINSPVNHITGCFKKASFLFGSRTETFQGKIIQFSFAELENATENFSASNLIGLGGSSYVYRGQLKDGSDVAIKRLKSQGGPEADSVFLTEIELLSRLHHCHLVPLLGYCSELKGKHVERLLVFEYMANGNLRDCLDGVSGEIMGWATRVTIAIGTARGLEYLHEAAAPRILHRDVKSTNILLDENWQAKITDLGLAKNLRVDDPPSCSNSPARMQGTFGYFAPEYAIFGRASCKSDVFSFGVVLLELMSGRQPIHKSTSKEESLVIWATPRLQDSRRVITELADPQLKGNFPEEEVQIMAYLAKECLLLDPDARPTMSEVVQILSTISPDKPRRRINIPVSLFQDPQDAENKMQAPSSKSSDQNSLPLGINQNLIVENKKEGAETVSASMERVILLTSKIEGWHGSDDETVDLTEPRFESFCLTNSNSL